MLFQDPSKVPAWLLVNKTVIPDFVVRDPKVCMYRVRIFSGCTSSTAVPTALQTHVYTCV